MPDIETLSTATNATILTLGACAFNIDTGEIVGKFHVQFSLEDQIKYGRHICKNTVEWWKKQSQEAQEEAFNQNDALPIPVAVQKLDDWVVSMRKLDPTMKANMWANDPDFDLVILTSMFRDVGKEPPWQYWESRSVRTMKMIGEKLKLALPKREGTHHNALDDAIYQATLVSTVWNAIG